MAVKDDLKSIIIEYLDKVASTIFINKSLAIIEESADNKESFLAVAERVSKRIALFIDTNMATKVFEVLKAEIERRELKPGTRRKYLRVPLRNRVYITYNRTPHELYSENISEGGMYITAKEPFPVAAEVEISLPLEAGSYMHLKGVVVNVNRKPGKQLPGMGIEFKELRDDERKILRDFVKRAASQNKLESKIEPAIKPSPAHM